MLVWTEFQLRHLHIKLRRCIRKGMTARSVRRAGAQACMRAGVRAKGDETTRGYVLCRRAHREGEHLRCISYTEQPPLFRLSQVLVNRGSRANAPTLRSIQ
eukprot:SAG11_NODE_404_length_9736_cov_20.243022_11_plen_101_part_00